MTEKNLGQLTRVDLRDIWANEATDFTPWLALPDNLATLGDTLGIDLELEALEKSVGPFSADILCKDIGTGNWVLIENQLERTDHKHLGQLLTYASGLQAATIVWISARFVEQHRSTLDWLNKITDDSFRFFGLEVELWQIGDSLVAPKFNVVSKPNDWSRSVAQAARAIDEVDLSEIKTLQLEYWTEFHAALKKENGPISGNRKPQPQSWMAYSVGRTYFNLGTAMLRPKKQIRVELYIEGENAKAFFNLLQQQEDEIKEELGYSLAWEELPNRRDSRIAYYLDNVNPEEKADWQRQHDWLAKHINDMYRIFASRVRALDSDAWQVES